VYFVSAYRETDFTIRFSKEQKKNQNGMYVPFQACFKVFWKAISVQLQPTTTHIKSNHIWL